ncbi:Double-strand-break repair protein rad21-like [Pseudocercospora fuligena]|uniref:Double-strand-break repair protein rad21-like n=1 Tax=Pseudocercospora fuligena TaxID=685502 RepID=A0A8H6RIT7_9PEZI|nr:Double-strand-break repair protein rad21-like [Pseudocercospora fuligena]
MFYEATLLSKTGPLARVWLASNLDRKLTKQNVLQSNLETNVKDIIGESQAPMALRLSGQLLLGVVKIYNRKAKYLMDDCNDALMKIRVAFKPGNVDLPADQSHRANPNALILPDTITELDLFAPLPDPEDLLREPEARAPGQDPTLLDFGMSQIMDSQTPTRPKEKRTLQLDDDDLGLDLGLDMDNDITRLSEAPSIERGRRAPTPRRDEPTLLEDDDLGLDFGFNDDTTLRPTTEGPDPMMGGDDDLQMGGMDDDEIARANAAAMERVANAGEERRRSESILSSVRSSVERDLEKTFQLDQEQMQEDEDPTVVQAAQRVKRRKVVRMDNETEIHNSQIKKMQEDRSAITKAPTYLPRDPLLLQLMEMQRNGSFISNLMDGQMRGWAPELRGILSLEVVRKAGDKKRKRDSGIADVETDGERQESPQLEIPQDEDEGFQADAGAHDFDATANDDVQLNLGDDDEHQEYEDHGANFDVTEAPLLHPSQGGAVALGTKKMVHMLREHFAPEHPKDANEPPTPSKRVKSSALFTDLCPEKRTTKEDATKMFFELLVLGTKDAIKIEQDSKGLGLPIRVRGKRGLWGDWAEMQSGGEIASQTQQEAQPAPIEGEA